MHFPAGVTPRDTLLGKVFSLLQYNYCHFNQLCLCLLKAKHLNFSWLYCTVVHSSHQWWDSMAEISSLLQLPVNLSWNICANTWSDVVHPKFLCTCTMTIKGYSIPLFHGRAKMPKCFCMKVIIMNGICGPSVVCRNIRNVVVFFRCLFFVLCFYIP